MTHKTIFVTGHRGMVGSALVRRLEAGGYSNVLTRTRSELDLLDQRAVHAFLAEARVAARQRIRTSTISASRCTTAT